MKRFYDIIEAIMNFLTGGKGGSQLRPQEIDIHKEYLQRL